MTKYQQAVQWIADNDEPTDRNPDTVAELITVALVADLFKYRVATVAGDVVGARLENYAGPTDTEIYGAGS